MNKLEVRSQVKEVIANVSGIALEDIGDNESLEKDLGLDSLAMLEISVDLELQFREFNINIPDDEIAEIRTVQDVVEKIHEYLCRKAEGV